MVQLCTINRIIKAYALVGFCVATYALYVEISLENDPDFEPLCDLRKYVKCSPAFISPLIQIQMNLHPAPQDYHHYPEYYSII
ncbi:vitamin K epoxide reductase complex subunit 1-like protein 1 [Aphis craccivora]|uniref:Vitamin K epoxide reductase complex subunit 1-like protein 1 n=1 Tax=Aphis craccivora TaxID=307492 RepID=A0A6G0YCY7_APHCR|nr:vitamin K epoxide reductase complex subunit 1-like protein 1 [Aphis craccivora]